MKLITSLFGFIFLVIHVFAEKLTELNVGVTKEPSECNIKAARGDVVSVHYTGKLRDSGEVFDSSYNRGVPIQFKLGYNQVISGWDQGILGMCIGEGRTLHIPSELGYGSRGAGGVIPPNADLVFDTELVNIQRDSVDDEL
ncbi:unnamed protein product [Kluyveromyces dobzhanskii CBS 2104]|uniref:peptidylprolyl isomerase n=1 Tax=Kluyveromyces dobzhanskii CBS 2104 TaxID=1427455 RepID=A0A0A8L395_9SACH|nr:unnamed protein product [Kluyveromyces dobzhanskii CBS 2104]